MVVGILGSKYEKAGVTTVGSFYEIISEWNTANQEAFPEVGEFTSELETPDEQHTLIEESRPIERPFPNISFPIQESGTGTGTSLLLV